MPPIGDIGRVFSRNDSLSHHDPFDDLTIEDSNNEDDNNNNVNITNGTGENSSSTALGLTRPPTLQRHELQMPMMQQEHQHESRVPLEYTELRSLNDNTFSSSWESDHSLKFTAIEIARIQNKAQQLRRARAWDEDLPTNTNTGNANNKDLRHELRPKSRNSYDGDVEENTNVRYPVNYADPLNISNIAVTGPNNAGVVTATPAIMNKNNHNTTASIGPIPNNASSDTGNSRTSQDGSSVKMMAQRQRQGSPFVTGGSLDNASRSISSDTVSLTSSTRAKKMEEQLLRNMMNSPRQGQEQHSIKAKALKKLQPPPYPQQRLRSNLLSYKSRPSKQQKQQQGFSYSNSGDSQSLSTNDSDDLHKRPYPSILKASQYSSKWNKNNTEKDFTDNDNPLDTSDPVTERMDTSAETDEIRDTIIEEGEFENDEDDNGDNDSRSENDNSQAQNLNLHDLCGEASGADDIAWRNALFLLSTLPDLTSVVYQGWTPLHISCMGIAPPPLYMIQALVYTYPQACRMYDTGRRLPLHLVAASSGDVEIMQLLVETNPKALCATDEHGYTPLHLLLKNLNVELTVARIEVLLGETLSIQQQRQHQQSISTDHRRQQPQDFFLVRRGEHLDLTLSDLERIKGRKPPVTVLHKTPALTGDIHKYPPDVQASFRQLTAWKRKQERDNDNEHLDEYEQEYIEDMDSNDGEAAFAETDPAAIMVPHTMQLPIHMAVYRGVVKHSTIENVESMPTSAFSEEKKNEDAENEDIEMPSRQQQPKRQMVPSIPNLSEILRLLISAYPQGLAMRDDAGMTPLLMCLTSVNMTPSLDTIELLLGKRSPGYHSLPVWSRDMPLHQMSHPPFVNAAMIPMTESGQLPLHVAAEEFSLDYSIMNTIYDSYPGAAYVQDKFGRTPLHIILSNYRGLPIDPIIVALIVTDEITQIRDDYGNLPFDLLVRNSSKLPYNEPKHLCKKDGEKFFSFFHTSILTKILQNSDFERQRFFDNLRLLPVWLRTKACFMPSVQSLLVKEVASPLKFILIVADGLLLLLLITIFLKQIRVYTDGISSNDTLLTWYAYCIYATACIRLICRISLSVLSISVGHFIRVILFDPWYHIDIAATLLTVGTSALLYGSVDNGVLLALSTATIGALWLAALGFLANWIRGMAIFVGAIGVILRKLFWPIIALSLVFVAFAQMFYTLLQIRCNQDNHNKSDCAVHDAYRIVYMLWRGESISQSESTPEYLSNEKVLLVLFLATIYLFLLGMLVLIVAIASKWDWPDSILDRFWEHKLVYVLSLEEMKLRSQKYDPKRALEASFSDKMRIRWSVLVTRATMQQPYDSELWYKNKEPSILSSITASLLLVIWFVIGLLSIGLLWPPQMREACFRHWLSTDANDRKSRSNSAFNQEQTSLQVFEMRNELSQLKAMSYERYGDIERQVRGLKDLFLFALNEDT